MSFVFVFSINISNKTSNASNLFIFLHLKTESNEYSFFAYYYIFNIAMFIISVSVNVDVFAHILTSSLWKCYKRQCRNIHISFLVSQCTSAAGVYLFHLWAITFILHHILQVSFSSLHLTAKLWIMLTYSVTIALFRTKHEHIEYCVPSTANHHFKIVCDTDDNNKKTVEFFLTAWWYP